MPTITFHVTRSANRESIHDHGLDWRHFREGTGLAGPSEIPEGECIFLARDSWEVEWFVGLCRSRHPSLDIWEVTLPHDFNPWADRLPPDTPYLEIDGFLATTEPIPADRLRLAEKDR